MRISTEENFLVKQNPGSHANISIVYFVVEMGVMPEIGQAVEEMDWR